MVLSSFLEELKRVFFFASIKPFRLRSITITLKTPGLESYACPLTPSVYYLHVEALRCNLFLNVKDSTMWSEGKVEIPRFVEFFTDHIERQISIGKYQARIHAQEAIEKKNMRI